MKRLLALLAFLGTLVPLPGVADSTIDEYEVKAAFLYNFAKFVRWPEAEASDPRPFRICVLGDDPFGSSLEETIAGRRVRDRPIETLHLTAAGEAGACEIVFVAASERRRVRWILEELANRGVLTVGETEGFADAGGVVNFVLEDNRVRFEINVAAARRAELKVSSQILSLARLIRPEGPDR